MKPPAPLNYIRSFECSARHLSFTAAAKELGYTQAAVSTHVRALEHHIGRQLFIRYPRSLKLTDMGEAFLPTLRQALDQIDHATEAIVTSTRKRTVVVSCPMSLAENWLAGCLTAFRKRYPDIEVVLHGTIWEIGEQVADLTIHTRRFDDRPADSMPLWNEELVLLCSPEMMQGDNAIREPQDILQVDWIFVHGRQEYWQCMAEALGVDVGDYDRGLKTNASNIALELAARGAGLVATQGSLAKIYMQRGLLVEPFPVRPASPWNYYLTEGQISKGKIARIVRDWIFEQAAKEGV